MNALKSNTVALVGLRSGGVVKIEPDGVDVSAVTPEDIAYGLAGENRFSNQLNRPLTVAEHSVLGTYLLPEGDPKLQLQFLLHDAPEALGLGDISGPLKNLIRTHTPVIEIYESMILAAIMTKYDLPPELDWRVTEADKLCGAIELTHLHPALTTLTRIGYKHHPIHEADPQVRTVRRMIDRNALTSPVGLWLYRWDELRKEIAHGSLWDRLLLDDLRVNGTHGYHEQKFIAGRATHHKIDPTSVRVSLNRLVSAGKAERRGEIIAYTESPALQWSGEDMT